MNFVIGSGPAGISCAQGLLAQGAEVTLLDSGLSLEAERLTQIGQLSNLPYQSWTPESISFLKKDIGAGTSGIPLKLAYGSDYPYRQPLGATPVSCENAESKPSYARGGLSTVWGSAVLPYRQEDLTGWPIGVPDLAPAYKAILEFVPLAGQEDELAALFPLYSDRAVPLPVSRQASSLLRDLSTRRQQLQKQGLFFGTSRLAVNAGSVPGVNGDGSNCVSCGLCMYGCPHGLIYSSDSTLKSMLAHPRFTYKSGHTVQSVREEGDGVVISAVDASGAEVNMSGDRVFLAAGVLGTASILLRSTGQYETPLELKDSQYFLLPLLRLKGTSNVVTERLHTLAQLFVEVFDPAVSPYTIHLQTYTYNELFRDPVLAALGPAKSMFPLNSFLGRLLLFQGYLHSQHSSPIQVALHREGPSDRLSLIGKQNAETSRTLKRLVKKLLKMSRLTGLLPLFPMLQPGQPGRGFHSGGTFPMKSNPGRNETDVFGRFEGRGKIHVVDASVLPTIPATTITFTVMANAYRIGSLLPQYA